MTFEEYLITKKIDSEALKKTEPQLWQEWQTIFDQVSPNSFTAQKLYLINSVRRKYQLKESVPQATPASAESKPAAKPMMRPKPKM